MEEVSKEAAAKAIGDTIINMIFFIVLIVLALVIVLTIISAIANRKRNMTDKKGQFLWRDRKHTFLGLPWSFTVYSLSAERLFVKTGFFTAVENEVRLYRILDLQFRATLGQRILGLGSIIVKSSDKTMKTFVLENIAHARDVKELMSENVEKQRKENHVSNREIMTLDDEADNDDDHDLDLDFDDDHDEET